MYTFQCSTGKEGFNPTHNTRQEEHRRMMEEHSRRMQNHKKDLERRNAGSQYMKNLESNINNEYVENLERGRNR
jgi:hypothetical protein